MVERAVPDEREIKAFMRWVLGEAEERETVVSGGVPQRELLADYARLYHQELFARAKTAAPSPQTYQHWAEQVIGEDHAASSGGG